MTSWLRKNNDIIIITVIILALTLIGRMCSQYGMYWYRSQLALPSIVPPDWVFPVVWTSIYIMCAAAALILVRSYEHTFYYRRILGLFVINAVLNLAWTYLFFVHHAIFGALLDAIVLELTLILLIALTWWDARIISWLLLPYACWVGFAIYLNYLVYLMN